MGNKHFEKGGEPDDELKTMKDIEWKIGDNPVEKLKTEAIKWVKYNMNISPITDFDKGAINIFRIFFNITEEDLK